MYRHVSSIFQQCHLNGSSEHSSISQVLDGPILNPIT
jgi:hypothetical protein